jgi:hypothetical protein
VEQAAAKVCQIAARGQMQERARSTRSFELGLEIGAFAVPSWLLFGGIALAFVYSSKPKYLSLHGLLNLEVSSGFNPIDTDAVLGFWLLFWLLLGVELSLLTTFGTLWFARRELPPPRALPPLDEQSPPRCHLCGAGLSRGGVRRRCDHCGTSNLVDGQAFDAQIVAMNEQLNVLERGLDERARAAGTVVTPLVMASAFYPVVLLFAIPIATIWARRTRPDLLAVHAVLLGLVALSVLLWWSRAGDGVRSLASLTPGAGLWVRGRPYTVTGVLEGLGSYLSAGSKAVVARPAHEQGDELAIAAMGTDEHGRFACFWLKPGGEPLAGSAPTETAVVTLSGPQNATQGTVVGGSPVRLFVGPLAPGAQPRWTLAPTTLGGDELLVP